jgi:ABC-type dipeptide/oligopeptide/nickel transport system permease subunit
LSVKRLQFRKISVLFSILFLALSTFFAIFCFYLVPDNTKNCNYQIPEIALAKPGFAFKILKVKNGISDQSWFNVLVYGHNPKTELIPFTKSTIIGKDIKVIRLAGFDEKGMEIDGGTFNFPIENSTIMNKRYYLGSDALGRDIFSRIILGLRISLLVGILSVIISLVFGVFLGSVSGYFGGVYDKIISLVINVFWSIPSILLVFAIILAFGKGFKVVFLAIGLSMWVDVARIMRGQVLQIRNLNYIEAAKSLGVSNFRIILKHILPNCIGPLLVISASNFATAILMEAGLSYLGLGIQPPTPSCGNMLNENFGYAISGNISIALAPSLVIILLVLSFNILGNWLRDYFDTKTIFE